MPVLSVVIATYQGAERLRRCLGALARQAQPADDFEVIVAVDGSTDHTSAVLAELDAPYQLRTISRPNAGPGAARNRGAAAATGRYLLFLDDDIVAAPALVAEHLRLQRAHDDAAVLGRLSLDLPRRADAAARAFAESWEEHYAGLAGGSAPGFLDCYSGNLSVSRELFERAGRFAEDLPRSEDIELGFRLARHGARFVYAPAALGVQHYRKGAQAIAADAEAAGRASVELYRRHPELLPSLGLGQFHDESFRALLLRRLLLALRVPVAPVALAGRLAARRRSRGAARFVDRFAYWRGVRRAVADRDTWDALTRGTAILMYHACGRPGEPASPYILPARRFARQMAWLRRAGYRVIELEAYLECRRQHRLPPPRSVVITFDDGYADNGELAGPVLRRHRFPATIFLVTRLVGDANRWDRSGPLAGRPLLSWSAIQTATPDLITYGAHTRTHPALPSVPTARLAEEIAGSRADLERRLGKPVLTFAYPFGLFDAAATDEVRRSGYELACATTTGVNDPATPLLALRRLDVRGTMTLPEFAVALWLGSNQPLRRLGQRT